MAEPTTFIKVDRNMTEWRWFNDATTLQLFLYLLLKANIKDKEYMGVTIHRGDVVTSYQTLSNVLGTSIRGVRTALGHLKSTGEVTSRAYSKFSVITIVSWEKYQGVATRNASPKRQASDKQATSNRQHLKNNKNKEEGKKKEINKESGGEELIVSKPGRRTVISRGADGEVRYKLADGEGKDG